jgi:hypothetical protein
MRAVEACTTFGGAPMASLPTVVGVLSRGFLLNLGMSNVAQVHAASTAHLHFSLA